MRVSPRSTGRAGPKPGWSLARQLLVLQVVVVAALVGISATLAYLDASNAVRDAAAEEVTSVAATLADSPGVREALASEAPTAGLQPFTEHVRADTGIDFITIMNLDLVRYTHPDPQRIGERFVGNTAEALRGHPFTEEYTGTLGPSVRTVAPVLSGGRVIALVAVGITIDSISAELRERLVPVGLVAAGVLLVGLVGSYLVSARLRRQTHGVGTGELSEMFSYYEAILHSVREGLVLVGRDGRVVLCNDGARELLGLRGDVRGTPVTELGLSAELAATFTATEARGDELHVTDTRVLLVNTAPVRSDDREMGREMGNVVTLRDHTELQTLTGELDTVRGFAESLRAQAHESANRLHAVVSLVELGRSEQAVELATSELETAQELTDRVVGAVSEPVLAALLLGKSSEASERGVELVITADTAIDGGESGVDTRDLITIVGNLVDNAVDAAVENAAERAPTVTVTVRSDDAVDGAQGGLLLRVADTGKGVAHDQATVIFRKGWSTKQPAVNRRDEPGRGLGLALVGQAVRRHHGAIDVTTDSADGGGAVFTVRLPVAPS